MASVRQLLSLAALVPVFTGTVLVAPVFTHAASAARPVAPMIIDAVMDGATPLDDAPRAARMLSAPNLLFAQLHDVTVRPFTTLGVTWRTAANTAPLAIRVSVRSHGKWSEWINADATDMHPDRHFAKAGTDPIWVGRSDAFKVEVRRDGAGEAPHGLTVTTIDPGTSPADGNAVPTASASASAMHPNWVTRAGWGADERLMNWDHEYAPTVKTVFLHHTDSTNNYTRSQAAAQIRAIYAYHARTLGWGDIGYNYIVDKYGTVYEGRSGGIDSTVVGGHTYGFNNSTSGIGLLGTFSNVAPTSAMVGAIERLIAWKLSKYYRNPQSTQALTAGLTQRSATGRSYVAGRQYAFNVISGHRDGYQTDCPGNGVYSRLPQIRNDVARLMGARLYDPVAVAIPGSLSLPGGIDITSNMAGTLSWHVIVQNTSNGALMASYSGSSTGSMKQRWTMVDGLAPIVLPGTYKVTLSASDGRTQALPATFTVTLSSGQGGNAYPIGTFLKQGNAYYRVDRRVNGMVERRPVLPSALQTYPNVGQAVTPPAGVLNDIPLGAPLGWAEGTLVSADPNQMPYLVSGGQLRRIPADLGLANWGYSQDQVLPVPSSEIAQLYVASNVSGANHPAGSYIRSGDTVYEILKGANGALYRRPVVDQTALTSWIAPTTVVPANDADQSLYLDDWERGVADGTLVTIDGLAQLYVVSVGVARPITKSVSDILGFHDPLAISHSDLGHQTGSFAQLGDRIDSHQDAVHSTAISPNAITKVASWTSTFYGTPVDVASRSPKPALP